QGISYVRSPHGIANHIDGLSSRLARNGYRDSFFYGGKRYSCDFDCYWQKVGLRRYFCEENFPRKITKELYSGWGIHDLPWLSYVADVLAQEPEPFVSGIFTLSSHHPFGIPRGFENTFPKSRHPIQETVAYTDHALKGFFEKISSAPWYKNTLFVLVADHTSGAVEPYYHGPIGSFSIPILLFDPEGRLPLKYAGQLAQQIDLFPTLLHLLGHTEPHVAFGHNLLDEQHPHFVVNFLHEIYQLIGDDYLLQFDGDRTLGFFDRKKDPLARKNLLSEPEYDPIRRPYERFLQAFLQHYSRALTRDALTVETWTR
ncbi:MAG: sulfatase-like hydrolase/transferase, partial [Puniceicoccales bacterium]|nr:sulfatase-like hydrolase/transferase [Puniceicoccales bacterium]